MIMFIILIKFVFISIFLGMISGIFVDYTKEGIPDNIAVGMFIGAFGSCAISAILGMLYFIIWM